MRNGAKKRRILVMWFMQGLCKVVRLHLQRAKQSKDNLFKSMTHALCKIGSQRNNAVSECFLSPIYREDYVPSHTTFKGHMSRRQWLLQRRSLEWNFIVS